VLVLKHRGDHEHPIDEEELVDAKDAKDTAGKFVSVNHLLDPTWVA